jgi:hypothetical protein
VDPSLSKELHRAIAQEKISSLIPNYSPKMVTVYGYYLRKFFLRVADQLIVDMPQIDQLRELAK